MCFFPEPGQLITAIPAHCHACPSGQVVVADDVAIAVFRQYPPYRFALVKAVLQHQHGVVAQVAACAGSDPANVIKALITGDQRVLRFKADIAAREVLVGGGYIRRVADDEIKTNPGKRRAPVTAGEFDIVQLQLTGIACGNRKRGCRPVAGEDMAGGPLVRNGQRDGTTAGIEIGYPCVAVRWQMFECRCDQCFAFRSRDKRVMRDGKRQ